MGGGDSSPCKHQTRRWKVHTRTCVCSAGLRLIYIDLILFSKHVKHLPHFCKFLCLQQRAQGGNCYHIHTTLLSTLLPHPSLACGEAGVCTGWSIPAPEQKRSQPCCSRISPLTSLYFLSLLFQAERCCLHQIACACSGGTINRYLTCMSMSSCARRPHELQP